jgi:hypothetical protein
VSITDNLADSIAEKFALQGERIAAEIRAGLLETTNALRLQGSRNLPIYANTTAWRGPGRLMGWSVRETAAAPATVTLHDGRDSSGAVLGVLNLAAGEADTQPLPAVSVTESLYVAVTGAVQGSIYFGATD